MKVSNEKRSAPGWRALLFLGSVALVATGCSTFRQPGDEWFGRDKAKHFITSTTVSAVTTRTADRQGYTEREARFIAFGFTLSLGAGKETYDHYVEETYFSGKDMFWNILGAAAGNALITVAD